MPEVLRNLFVSLVSCLSALCSWKRTARNYQQAEKRNTHNQEAGCNHRSFYVHVQVHGECDAEVVSVSEVLLHNATPLLPNLPDRSVSVC